jgi:hypothetical protein
VKLWYLSGIHPIAKLSLRMSFGKPLSTRKTPYGVQTLGSLPRFGDKRPQNCGVEVLFALLQNSLLANKGQNDQCYT